MHTRMRARGVVVTGLLSGLFAVCSLGASDARAQQSEESTGSEEAQGDAPESELPSSPATPMEGVEERVVLAGESDSLSDFQGSDSVTGFDAADLEALGATSIADIAKFTPNLEIVTTGSTTPTFFIRGIGLNDFNANSTSAVAIYQDDVYVNSPALQLGALFDIEGVNVLRGPQGTGLARNASAGAIKLRSRKPSGRYGGYMRASYGRFNAVDVEGAVEAPIYEDIITSRFAFRYTDRDGWMKNNCGDAPPRATRNKRAPPGQDPDEPGEYQVSATDPLVSICGEPVQRPNQNRPSDPGGPLTDGRSDIPEGLPRDINDKHDWAARGTFLFEPTLDMEWLLKLQGSRRDEQSRLGQSIGTDGFFCDPLQPIENCRFAVNVDPNSSRSRGLLGAKDGGDYWNPDVAEVFNATLASNFEACGAPCDSTSPEFDEGVSNIVINNTKIAIAEQVGPNLDKRPRRGDFNFVGDTINDTWGGTLKGDVALGRGIDFTTVTGYYGYDRSIGIDLDQSPTTLFQVQTDDQGWQFTQDVKFSGYVSDDVPLRLEVGGFFLRETINVQVQNDFGNFQFAGVASRDYTQKLWSAAGYGSFEWTFWDDFTLDGGVRYNWDRKTIDYVLGLAGGGLIDYQDHRWDAPTGTIRLTYRFREDTHAYWKYTRGWKGGHYNATSNLRQGITAAEPEQIDAFEVGLRGSWLDGRLNLDAQFFVYDYSDYQLFTAQQQAGGQPEFVVINASDTRVYGAELDLKTRIGVPWEAWPLPPPFVNVRFGWLESEFIDFTQEQISRVQVGEASKTIVRQLQNSGHRLLNSPRFKVSITGEQVFPLDRYGSLAVRYDGAWSDVTYFDPTQGRGIPNSRNEVFLPKETIAQKAYWLHNLRLSYITPDGTIEVAGWVRNLLDESYKTFAFDGSTFNSTTIYFTGDPRTYGGSVSINF